MLLLKLLPIFLMMALGLIQQALAHRSRWRDRRTKVHLIVRRISAGLFVALALVSAAIVFFDHQGAARNEARMSGLVQKNEELTERVSQLQKALDDEKSARLSGRLLPANEPRPPLPHSCGDIPDDALILLLGDQVAWMTEVPGSIPVLRVSKQVLLTIDRSQQGVYLSATVFRKDGRGVATISKNEFEINPENYFHIVSRDRHELVIVDKNDIQVLRVRFLNENTFQITGVFFFAPGKTLVIEPDVMKIILPGTNIRMGGTCMRAYKGTKAIFDY